MTSKRYTKLKEKYWYRDNAQGVKRYKRKARSPQGTTKEIWGASYSDWGGKKDKWIEEQRVLNETGLSQDELERIDNITIADLSREWIYTVSPTRVKNGTVEKRESNYNNLVKNSPLNEAKVRNIDSRHIKRYFKTLENYAAKSRAKDYLNPLFEYAMEIEIISYNPMPKNLLKALNQEEKLHKANKGINDNYDIIFDDEEMQYLFNKAKEYKKDVHIPIALMMYNGMRISEALAVQVKNIDLKKGTIQVTKQTQALKKSKHGKSKGLVPPKTANSVRTFP